MKIFKTKPTEASRPKESHVLIYCSADAATTKNIILLNSTAKTPVNLTEGWNLVTISEYPDLKYGFSPAVYNHNSLFELNPNCQSVVEIDLSHFDASEVISTERMFADMSKLLTVDLSNVKFNHVTTMDRMFSRCFLLNTVIQNRFDTFYSKSLISAQGMFIFAAQLKRLSLPYLAHSGVKNLNDIFMGAESLEVLDLSGWNLKNASIGNEGGMVPMFSDCSMLTKIYAIGCNEFSRSKLLKQRDLTERCHPRLIFALNIQ